MPTTRFSDLPVISQVAFVAENTEVSLTLPGQCFGVQINVIGPGIFSSFGDYSLIRYAFEPGLVATGINPHFTVYPKNRDGISIAYTIARYPNYSPFIRIPRNKFVRDLTVYAAIDLTGSIGTVPSLQAIYWTTPTP